MRRKTVSVILILVCLLIAASMASCVKEKGPLGVCTDESGKEYYAIRLNSKETPKDYFKVKNLIGQNAVMSTVGDTSIKTINIYSVADGGKIAFVTDYSGRMFYFPEGFSYEEVEKKASSLALRESDFMSISSAKAYIPSLNK